MKLTALFVEILIIGVGALIWVFLLVAGLYKIQFSASWFNVSSIVLAPLTVVVYILGIISDRLVRIPFVKIEDWAERNVRKKNIESVNQLRILSGSGIDEPKAMELEKFIRSSSCELGHKIDYNRSRLKICRSWILHSILITVFFVYWVDRIGANSDVKLLYAAIIGIVFFGFTFFVSVILAIDHQRDVIESAVILLARSSVIARNTTADDRRSHPNSIQSPPAASN